MNISIILVFLMSHVSYASPPPDIDPLAPVAVGCPNVDYGTYLERLDEPWCNPPQADHAHAGHRIAFPHDPRRGHPGHVQAPGWGAEPSPPGPPRLIAGQAPAQGVGFDPHYHRQIMGGQVPVVPNPSPPPPAPSMDANVGITPASVPFWNEMGSKIKELEKINLYNHDCDQTRSNQTRITELAEMIRSDYFNQHNKNPRWIGLPVLDNYVKFAATMVKYCDEIAAYDHSQAIGGFVRWTDSIAEARQREEAIRKQELEQEARDPQGVIDLNQIPDSPYAGIRGPSDPFIQELDRISKDIYKLEVIKIRSEKRRSALTMASQAASRAEHYYRGDNPYSKTTYHDPIEGPFQIASDVEAATFYKELAKGLLDIAVGLDPITGIGRSSYELLTGKNLITGSELTQIERGFAFLGVVSAGTVSNVPKITRLIRRISANSTGEILVKGLAEAVQTGTHFLTSRVAESAARFRDLPGAVMISQALPNSHQLLRGQAMNAGLIPREIGSAMNGRQYQNFKGFRKDLWKTIATSSYADEIGRIDPRNLQRMVAGKAPIAEVSQRVGGRISYEIHHLKEIQHGGEVYDLSNLVIATPAYHIRVYHQ